jgi:hypothetical protein
MLLFFKNAGTLLPISGLTKYPLHKKEKPGFVLKSTQKVQKVQIQYKRPVFVLYFTKYIGQNAYFSCTVLDEEEKKSVNSFSSLFAPTFLIDINTMATHQCGSCLKKTIEGRAEADLPEGMVPAASDCGPGRGHTWKEIGNCVTPF